MMISNDKVVFYENFLKSTVSKSLNKLQAHSKGLWGKMNAQDMVEHLEMAVTLTTILKNSPMQAPTPLQEKSRTGLIYGDEEMPRNVQNPAFRYGLPPHKYPDLETAREKLLEKIAMFFENYKDKPDFHSWTMFAGDLNYAENLAFHYKHFKHHLSQFDLL